MKPQLTFVALLFLFLGSLSAQVKYKVKLLPDNQTYQVIFRPETTWANPFSTTTGGQVTMRVPIGGFAPGPITSIKGDWKLINTVTAPTEAPGYVYYIYGLNTPIPGNQITYTNGVEIPMFSYKNNGNCTGPVEIINNNTDPFLEPNSQSLGIKNYLTVLGAGQGVNAYIGNYTSFPADCTPVGSCGIEVFDVALTSPSACGIADGIITIDASNSNGLPMQYSINYGTPQVIWQSSPIFSNLAAGNTFNVAVRDIIGVCIEEVGAFQLNGPLAAIVQGVDIVQPDCGGTNGSITINAVSANGGTLQFAMNTNGPWQASHTFSNLAEGTYSLYVRDITNNCSNPVGTYTLTGCVEPNCILTYDINSLGNGKYEVTMLTDTTWNFPLNQTSNLQVTIKVPTGGFEAGNVVDQIPNVDFGISEVIVAPIEDPAYDYITFSLLSATDQIPYFNGNTVHLFTFDNIGTCTGDSIRFMLADDPFTQPNSENSSAGQYISVLGYGSADAPICIAKNAVTCDEIVPAPPSCLVTYEIEKLPGDIIQVSIIADTLWTGINNYTSAAQVTIKVPTGGFQVGSLTSLEGSWQIGATDIAPVEAPTSDYFTFILASPSNLNVFQDGVKVPVFTFKNTGTCQNGAVTLMADTDPFFPPNNNNSNVGQYMSPAGSQGEPVLICLLNQPVSDCTTDPCASLAPSFGPLQGCEGSAIVFKDFTITNNDAITSWSWDFGDNSAVSTSQNPSHTYSSSGNFEVSLTVTTQGGCSATYEDFVTVFPSPGDAPVSSYSICNGAPVTIETPANITSAVWTPTTGLNLTDPFNPIAIPAVTTVYTLTVTNASGCVNTSQVTVNVLIKPIINSVIPTQISDCNKSDGSIQISASGATSIEYGLDNGSGIVWQSASTFANLDAGSYNVYVRNADGSCEAAYNGNPVVLVAPVAPTITNVVSSQPNGCNNDGSIIITATGGTSPLNYSIGGPAQTNGSFTGLGAGIYNIVVTNANGTCPVLAAFPVLLVQPTPPTIVTPIADQKICVGASTNISVQLSAAIGTYTITGTGVHSGETVNGSTLNFVASANAAGATTYNVTLSEANGCSATSSFTLTGVAVPTSSFTVSPTICTNGDVVLNFTGTSLNSAKLTWSLAGGVIKNASVQNASSPDSATIVVNWATPGTKTITLEVDNGGCKVTSTQSITVSAFDPAASFTTTNATCGLDNGAIDLTVVGTGFNYAWNNNATTPDLAGIAAGTYTVTISEPNSGCQSTASTTITGSPVVNISTTKTDATSCTGANGDGSIKITVNSGTGPYTYSVTGQTPVPSPLSILTFSNLVAGVYTVIVTDAVGCSKSQVVTIGSISSQLTADVQVVDAGCTSNNGSVTATVSNGQAPYTYSLYKNNLPVGSGGVAVNGSTVVLSGLEPANYLLIFEDAAGCIVAASGTVERTEGVFPATATITDASCGSSNGSIVLAGVPVNASVAWSIGNGNGLSAGVYTVTITEAGGCTSSATFVVSTTGGADVTINSVIPASCGMANGTVVFTVTGGNSYAYKFLGASFLGSQGFGTPDVQTTVAGVPQGAYVLEITDLVTNNCKVYEVVIVPGSGAISLNSSTQYATGCGNHNGNITLNITGGQSPYTLVASDGISQNCGGPNQFCITGLYEGIVTINVTDANGCVSNFLQDMGDFLEPNITSDSIAITNPLCVDSLGSIVSASTSQYIILNAANNSVVGITPWTAAPAGTYLVIQSIAGCVDTLENVVVADPANWSVIPTIVPQGCGNDLGSISLAVSGATGPYTFSWGSSSTTSLIASTYPVTITDANGCNYEDEFIVPFDCPNPCAFADTLFYLDTVFIDLTGPITEFCLPTHESNLEDYDLTLNGTAYQREIGDCGDATNFYNGFDVLPTPGPYTLVEWSYGNEKESNFPFIDFEALVAHMNILDPLGNWSLDQGTIFGGVPGKAYGLMKIRHDASGNALDLQPSKLTIPSPTILIDNHSLSQVLIAMNANGCTDTLVINVQLPAPSKPDTIQVTVEVDGSYQVCFEVDDLVGVPVSLDNIGISLTNNAQIIETTGVTCVNVVGVENGPDQGTIVICDNFGICDTTYLDINVVDSDDEILVYTGFSPNGDGVNEFFKIKNIEKYPDNEVQIFNRWGKRVYSAKRYRNDWDGEYRNLKLPDGSYFYLLDVVVKHEKKKLKGYVEIRR